MKSLKLAFSLLLAVAALALPAASPAADLMTTITPAYITSPDRLNGVAVAIVAPAAETQAASVLPAHSTPVNGFLDRQPKSTKFVRFDRTLSILDEERRLGARGSGDSSR